MTKQNSTPIKAICVAKYKAWLAKQSQFVKNYLAGIKFDIKPGSYAVIAGKDGSPEYVLALVSDKPDMWCLAHLAGVLKDGKYTLGGDLPKEESEKALLGFRLGCYSFSRYKKEAPKFPTLGLLNASAQSTVDSVFLIRDLTNTPTEDMTPKHLAAAAKKVAAEFKAEFKEIVGDDLLKKNYPTIHAVGRASVNAPRLVDITWGNKKHPKVTLVGKGVCFDSGGLDIKGATGMLLMKKDMAGAAHALALGRMIMNAGLKLRLRILLPMVENSISSNAFRPLDVIKTRKGITVEIGNTDAEGRLILCDALAEADLEKPDLLLDFATLTGAARTALGTELPALFSNNDKLAASLLEHSKKTEDYFWQLPLWQPYREMMNSKVADINNAGDSPYAGAITAALYLKEFVTETENWAHFDMMAWNVSSKPGRPYGAEAQGIRGIFSYLSEKYN